MQKKARLRLRDILIVLICTGVCVASLYFFWKDLNSSSSRKDKDQIAKIEFKRRVAQRKFSDRVAWERLQQNSPLYDSDTIRTAEGAAATITFKDGTVLELHENTMLQVSYDETEGLKLAVNDGNIDVDTTSSLDNKKVSLAMENGSVFKLDSGSKLSATTNASSGDNSFKLQSGNATLTSTDANGKESAQQLVSGESVKVDSSGDLKKEALTVTTISSETKLLAFNNEKSMPVKLGWSTSSGYEKEGVTVETSLYKDFSKIKNSYDIKNKNEINLLAPVGKLYWRLYPSSDPSQLVYGRISLESVAPIVTVSPVSGSGFSYISDEELPKVSLKWSGNDYADHYRILVSKSQDLSNPIIDSEVSQQEISLKNLAQGNYYWQVTPYYKVDSIGYGKASNSSSFSITKIEKIPAPKLTIPAHMGKLAFSEIRESPLTFQWKSDLPKADYNLKVASDKNFKNIVYQRNTKGTRITDNFTLEKFPVGTYYWQVVRTSQMESSPSASEVREFSVERFVAGENKLIYPPDHYTVEKEKLLTTAFMWKLAPEYVRANIISIIQISSNQTFDKNLKEYKTNDTQLKNINLDKGTYYWRLAVQNPLTQEFIYTSPRVFEVLSPLPKPMFTAPVPASTLTVYGEGIVRFAWTKVEKADYYKLKVYDSKNKLIKEVASTKQLSANLVLEPNAYKCSLQAFSEENELSPRRSSQTSELSFNVRGPEPVKLISPANNARIPGLTALRSATVFTWKPGDKVYKSEFVLRKRQKNGSMKIVQTLPNPGRQISLNRLDPGTYQWTIRASSADGIPLNALQTYTFVVAQIPQLGDVTLISPVQNQLVDSNYLKNNRNIVFDWSDVAGASDYQFTLYQKSPDGSLKMIQERKNLMVSEYKLKDLSLLDIGDFEWNVTAYSHARDGFEEQKSKVATGNFKIEFDLPGKVQTIDPGKLYGE